MKKKILLPIIFLALGALVGCGGRGGSESTPDSTTSESEAEYTLAITNKAALQAEWHVREANRALELAIEPEVNIPQLIADEEILITSSDPTVVSAFGLYLSAVGEGTATITVSFEGLTDTVELEILGEKGEPEVVKGLTLAEVFEDGRDDEAVLYELNNLVITNWQSGKSDPTKYGNFMVSDDEGTTEILVYGATANTDAFAWTGDGYSFTNPQNFQTNDATKNIGLGYTLSMRVAKLHYNDTPELEGIVLAAEAPAAVPAESISLDLTAAYVRVNSTLTLKATQLPAGAADPVTWISSDTTVATVADGVVTGVKAGTATITAKVSDSITATSTITVEDLETEPTVVLNPVVGTSYKLGIKHLGLYAKQGTDWYYATGAMSGYYADTSAIHTAGADFTIEEATGGYHLACTVGTEKTYVNLVSDGTYTNIKYETAASSVYTVNATGELVTKIGEEDYVIGTSSSSLYNTLSPRKASASSYVATLLDVSALGSQEPETTPEPAAITVTKIAEALTAAEMTQSYKISGVTVESWRNNGTDGTKYGNFNITDGETTILVYGATASAEGFDWDEVTGVYTKFNNPQDFLTNDLTKTIVIGSKLDLTFIVTSYNGTKQLNAIVTAVDNSSVGGGEEPEEPVGPVEVTIAEALAAADNTQVIVRGIVKNIGTAWSDEHGNISVTIIDGNFDELYIFRMNTKVAVGDDITVTGTMTTYYGSRQIAQGSTAVINSSGNEIPAPVAGENEVIFDLAAQGYGNETEFTTLSSEGTPVVTLAGAKGSNTGNAPKFYTSGNAVRFYSGNTLTVSVESGYNIVDITIKFGSGDKTNAITSDVGTFTTDTWTGEANSVVLTVDGTSGHRRVASVTVTFAAIA